MLRWILLGVLLSLGTAAPNSSRQSSVTTGSLVRKHGYPFEEHFVTTPDGYILGLHRIPYSSKMNTTTGNPRPVAFLMHGFLSSSSDWTLLGPDNALAFLLSDAGYDVWLGNARGNVYSRKHISHNPLFKRFWDFDWHEIGLYDLPAMIKFIIERTGQKQVTYIGHSQGTTTFFVLNSLNRSFKNYIKSAHLLAPVAFMSHLKSPVVQVSSLFLGGPNPFPEFFGSMEFMPNTKLMEILGYTTCTETSPVKGLCSNSLFLIAGRDTENLNQTLVPDIMATSPAGSSVNQFFHYMQEMRSGYFRQFDYGMVRNLAKYGTRKPPNYPLHKIDVPIFLYYSENDYLSDVVDVEKLIQELPKSSVRRTYLVPHPKWNHFDFIWGLNIQEQVYNALFEDIISMQ